MIQQERTAQQRTCERYRRIREGCRILQFLGNLLLDQGIQTVHTCLIIFIFNFKRYHRASSLIC